ncbi:hypothetical protein IJH01_00865 [Candidatus Saccharibacteria bacterium]|nr:hypothetical protein [Candidatus Saccharibacteria bacterium]
MQVAKIVGLFVLSMMMFFMIGCMDKSTTADQARSVDYAGYGTLNDEYGYGGYRLEDFMVACGAVVVFQQEGNGIIADCNGWAIRIENYEIKSGQDEPFRCTQILLSKEGLPSSYAFGHLKDSMPRTVSQPDQVLVRDSGLRPWRQKLEKSSLEDLIELMTSGNLWEEKDDPLEGLGFSYLETDVVSGKKTIHRADGSSTPMEGISSTDEA